MKIRFQSYLSLQIILTSDSGELLPILFILTRQLAGQECKKIKKAFAAWRLCVRKFYNPFAST